MPAPDLRSQPLPAMLLDALAQFVAERLGLAFPPDRHELLARGIHAAAAESGFPNAAAYATWLLDAPLAQRHLGILASHLTIGETYFFREPAGLEALQHQLLPELVAARRSLPPGERRLRIWSAGCATGEEPYFIAMLLELAIPDLEAWDVTLLATDVNPRFLDRAQRGLYRDWSFRDMPEPFKQYFFHRQADGRLEIAARLRRRVTFAYLNLAQDDGTSSFEEFGDMDVILCRNVLIYFEASQARKVARRFADALVPGGSLLIGAAETAQPCFVGLDALSSAQPALYRKQAPVVGPARVPRRATAETTSPPTGASVVMPQATGNASKFDHAALAPFRQGRHREAPRLAEERLEGAPTALLARIHADRGALAEAIEWSSEALAGNKTDAHGYYLHASILIEMGRRAEAVKALNRVLYLAPEFVLAHYALGVLAKDDGKRGRARKHFDNALAILAHRPPDEVLAEANGLEVRELAAIIRTLRGSILAEAVS